MAEKLGIANKQLITLIDSSFRIATWFVYYIWWAIAAANRIVQRVDQVEEKAF